MEYTIEPIGIIHSCFKEKFGIPRQAGMVKDAPSTLELYPQYARPEAVRELKGFSHIWVIFIFHKNMGHSWKPTVRPPRLGGNKKIGVFSSRSPFRPNPIGLSAVEMTQVEERNNEVILHLKGADILDQTPVIDIKPYLPYSDIIETATGGFAPDAPQSNIRVDFTQNALAVCKNLKTKHPNLKSLIIQILENDPRPAYYAKNNKDVHNIFGMKLFDFDLKWTMENSVITVLSLDKHE